MSGLSLRLSRAPGAPSNLVAPGKDLQLPKVFIINTIAEKHITEPSRTLNVFTGGFGPKQRITKKFSQATEIF